MSSLGYAGPRRRVQGYSRCFTLLSALQQFFFDILGALLSCSAGECRRSSSFLVCFVSWHHLHARKTQEPHSRRKRFFYLFLVSVSRLTGLAWGEIFTQSGHTKKKSVVVFVFLGFCKWHSRSLICPANKSSLEVKFSAQLLSWRLKWKSEAQSEDLLSYNVSFMSFNMIDRNSGCHLLHLIPYISPPPPEPGAKAKAFCCWKAIKLQLIRKMLSHSVSSLRGTKWVLRL